MTRLTVARAHLALLAAFVVSLGLTGTAFAQVPVTNLDSGPSNADIAVAWSQVTFAEGSAPDVIIARDDNFADSFGATALQPRLEAPLLVTSTDVLLPQVATEIARLGAENAIILGGEAAVSPAVQSAVEALGLTTERVAGSNRISTAVAIVERFFPNATEVVLARAFDDGEVISRAFADSIGVSGYAATAGVPVLLTDTASLSAETATYLAGSTVQRIVVPGGTAAVSQAASDAALAAIDDDDDETEETLDRYAAPARDATAIALAGDLGYATAADAPRVILTEGFTDDAWSSGFGAGVQAGNGAVVLLSNGESISGATAAFLAGGGVPLICSPSVSDAACDAATTALNS